MTNIYDFIVIGAGISACTFASLLNKRSSDLSILLVEHGRRIGGRATTRKSRKIKFLNMTMVCHLLILENVFQKIYWS